MFKKLFVAAVGMCALSGVSAIAADMPVKAAVMKAPAPPAYRWYLEGRLGAPLRQDYDVVIGGGLGAATYRPKTGIHGAADIGVEFSRNWRAEFEFSYTTGSDGNVVLGGVNIPHAGRTNVYTYGVNAFYSFDLAPMLRPFVGVGAGLAHFDVRRLGAVGGAFVLNDSDTAPVVALHAGLDVPINKSVSLTGRYTFSHTGSTTFTSAPAGFTTSRSSADDHIFSGGVRFYLN